MKILFNKLFWAIVAAIFFAVIAPGQASAQHARYWCDGGYAGDNGTKCNQDAWHLDSCKDCSADIEFTVEAWQQCVASEKQNGAIHEFFITGYCHKDCLNTVTGSYYYDDPATPGIQARGNNAKKITLPVVLAWDDVNGFAENSTEYARCSNSGDPYYCNHTEGGHTTLRGNGYGPVSYRIQIWDDSNSGIEYLDIPPEKRGQIEYLDIPPEKRGQIENGPTGKKAFYAVLNKSGKKFGFNSRDNGGLCFFNSSNTYHWRVTACCNSDGTGCKEYPPDWWTFTTSSAPEMISPLDPDWNGPKAIEKSFKDIFPGKDPLKWCAARLPAEYQRKNYAIQYAKSYQMMVTSNEQNEFTNKLKRIISLFSGEISLGSYLSSMFNSQAATDPQKTHALSVVNGNLIYNVYPDKQTGEVETQYPAQARGDLAFFSRGRNYTWSLKSCPDDFTAKCFEDYGQAWKIKTKPIDPIDAPQPISPKDGETVGFPISISWTIPFGANSFRYETTIPNFTSERKATWNTLPNRDFDEATKKVFTLDNVAVKLNTTYIWRVQSCHEFDSNSSAECDGKSGWFKFTTTGRPPAKNSMKPNDGPDSIITFPQNFEWEKVPGARSYNIELDGAKGKKIKLVEFGPDSQGNPGTQFDYPDIQLPGAKVSAKTYTWRVQTCADSAGKICGAWENQSFTPKRPTTPTINKLGSPYGSLNDFEATWNGPTKYYWVTINYSKPPQLTQAGCDIANPIASRQIADNYCSKNNNCIGSDVKASCAGKYEIMILPCTNPDCSDTCTNPDCSTRGGENAARATFTIAEGKSLDNSFAVCNHNSNNPKTEWDETEKCEIKHVFLLLKISIDFLMFKLALLMLPILVLISGGIFYLGQQGPKTIPFIKNMWKWIGIGYALMIFAWLLVSWMMAIVGYSDLWWKVL